VSAVGAHIKLGVDTARIPWVRVVGVVADIPELGNWGSVPPTAKASRLGHIYYRPGARDSVQIKAHASTFAFTAIVRASSDPMRMPVILRRAMLSLAPGAVQWTSTMEEATGLVAERQAQDFIAGMFVLFTTLALALAAFGVYGIVAHSVAERRRELGVRVALGASSRNILGLVLREGNVFALAGIALGLWFTKSSIWYVRAFSIEDDAYNAPLFAAMAAVLFAAVVCAALVPALRATRIDPVESLRND
jgi:ABC-type antimicrobial peptide transport system permease subunit